MHPHADQPESANRCRCHGPDGSRFAIVTDDDYSVQVYSADTGALQQTLTATNAVQDLMFSPAAASRRQRLQRAGGSMEWLSTQAQTKGTPGPPLLAISSNHSGTESVTTSASGIVNVWTRAVTASSGPSMPARLSPRRPSAPMTQDRSQLRRRDSSGIRCRHWSNARRASATTRSVEDARSAQTATAFRCCQCRSTGCVQVWNAELATTSFTKLQMASHRVTALTPAQRRETCLAAD